MNWLSAHILNFLMKMTGDHHFSWTVVLVCQILQNADISGNDFTLKQSTGHCRNPAPFLPFSTPPPLLNRDENLEIMITQNEPHKSDIGLHNFCPLLLSLLARRGMIPIFGLLYCQCPFNILLTRLNIQLETASQPPIPRVGAFFLATRYPLCQDNSCSFLSFRSVTT